MAENEIVPSTELVGLEKTLGDVEALTRQVDPLYQKAKDTDVKYPDREGYAAISEILSQERSLKKEGEAYFAPFEIIVTRVKTFLKTKLQKHTNRCEEVDAICRAKMKPWEQAEMDATREEQEELNRKALKSGKPAVEVKPSIPPVAGYRRSTTYPVTIEDVGAFVKKWAKTTDRKEKAHLWKFITLDEKALASEARQIQDPVKFMKMFPGVKCERK